MTSVEYRKDYRHMKNVHYMYFCNAQTYWGLDKTPRTAYRPSLVPGKVSVAGNRKEV